MDLRIPYSNAYTFDSIADFEMPTQLLTKTNVESLMDIAVLIFKVLLASLTYISGRPASFV